MAERGLLAQRVHRYARSATATAGRMTAFMRTTPDYLIVGAQRCGTTSLYKTLIQHPSVLPAGLHKGIHYFDTNYDRGFDWYRSHFPTAAAARHRARLSGEPTITGEASPYYMFHPLAAERIARDLPGVRLLVLLRDPVERAYSAYTHERARGFEDADFETALDLEDERLAGEEQLIRARTSYASSAHQHNAYVARGHYVDQLQRLEQLVGREQMCVIDSDDLFAHFDIALGEVLGFLGLRDWLPDAFEQKNARPRSALPGQIRQRLEAEFQASDERLETWWGRTPSWRR